MGPYDVFFNPLIHYISKNCVAGVGGGWEVWVWYEEIENKVHKEKVISFFFSFFKGGGLLTQEMIFDSCV